MEWGGPEGMETRRGGITQGVLGLWKVEGGRWIFIGRFWEGEGGGGEAGGRWECAGG